jgi:DNA-binding winged helix-turn-helix (wHTH) protein
MGSSGSTRNSMFVFGEYVLKPSERLLLRNGDPIPLKAKVFETLLTLVENHGRILSKEDLMKLIWSGPVRRGKQPFTVHIHTTPDPG